MQNTLNSIKKHTRYLLSETKDIIKNNDTSTWEYSLYFKQIVSLLHKIAHISNGDQKELIKLIIPTKYHSEVTDQGITNAFSLLEINFWTVIRYSLYFNQEIGTISNIKNKLQILSKLLIDEINSKQIPNIDIEVLIAIRDWNTQYPKFEDFFKINKNQFNMYKSFHQIQYKYTYQYWEIDRFLQILHQYIWFFYDNSSLIKKSILEQLFLFEVYHVIRTADQSFLFKSSPRYREYFGWANLQIINDYIKNPNIKNVLDLYSNTGCIGILCYLYNKSFIHLNDACYCYKTSSINNLMQEIQEKYYSDHLNKNHDTETRSFSRLEKKTIDLIEEKKEKLKYTSDHPFLPITSSSVNFNDLWAITGPPETIKQDYWERTFSTNIEISERTKPSDFNSNRYDLIIIDPPFGVASKYQIQETKAKSLLYISIKLASQLITNKGIIIIRKKRDWILENLPQNWKKERQFGTSSNVIIYRVSNIKRAIEEIKQRKLISEL